MTKIQHHRCGRKVRHANIDGARIALRRTIEETSDLSLVYYACPYCKGYHIGHPKKAVQRVVRTKRLLALIDRAIAA